MDDAGRREEYYFKYKTGEEIMKGQTYVTEFCGFFCYVQYRGP
jgi:hypothetical protein